MNNPYNTKVKPLRNEWRDQAKCNGDDPEKYDLARAKTPSKDYIAYKLCKGCPVIAECAADVLERNNYGTVRAGMWFATWALSPDRRAMTAENAERVKRNEMRLRRLAAGFPLEEADPEPKSHVTVSVAS